MAWLGGKFRLSGRIGLALTLCLAFGLAACGDDGPKALKAHIGKTWELNFPTGIGSINGLSAVTVKSAEIQFEGEDRIIPLSASSPTKDNWVVSLKVEGLLNVVEPHEELAFDIHTVLPNEPEWVGRTATMRWGVVVTYPRVTKEDSNRYKEHRREVTLEQRVRFLPKKAGS